MKKILSLITLLALLTCALVSCSEIDSVGNATIVIATQEPQVYDVPLSKLSEGKGIMPALEYLRSEYGVQFEETSGYINSIGGLANDYEKGTYIYIYTSVEKDFDVSEYKTEIEYEGKTLVSTGVGIYDMSLLDGAVIYVGTIEW